MWSCCELFWISRASCGSLDGDTHYCMWGQICNRGGNPEAFVNRRKISMKPCRFTWDRVSKCSKLRFRTQGRVPVFYCSLNEEHRCRYSTTIAETAEAACGVFQSAERAKLAAMIDEGQLVVVTEVEAGHWMNDSEGNHLAGCIVESLRPGTYRLCRIG